MSTYDFVFANNVSTTLADPLSNSGTTITLASAANLPTLQPGQTWAITLNDAATQSVWEVIYVPYGGISGAVLSGVSRGQEGTAAVAWLVGDYASGDCTAGELANFQQTSLPTVGTPLQFVNIEAPTISNFNTLTQINTTSYSIPAGALTQGACIRVSAVGVYAATATPTNLTLEMKIGGQDVQSFPFTTVEGTDQAFNMIYMATCTETGTSGSTEVLQIQMGLRSNDIAQTWPFFIDGTGISINTTIANDINFYAQYSVASVHNTVTLLAWSVELMYPPPGNVIT